MTKDEAINLCQYYIGKAVEAGGMACVSVERNDGEWMVRDCSNVKAKEAVL